MNEPMPEIPNQRKDFSESVEIYYQNKDDTDQGIQFDHLRLYNITLLQGQCNVN